MSKSLSVLLLMLLVFSPMISFGDRLNDFVANLDKQQVVGKKISKIACVDLPPATKGLVSTIQVVCFDIPKLSHCWCKFKPQEKFKIVNMKCPIKNCKDTR